MSVFRGPFIYSVNELRRALGKNYIIEADKIALDNVRTKLIGVKLGLWLHRETWL